MYLDKEYMHYVKIRDCVNEKKCKKITVHEVMNKLENNKTKQFVKEVTRLTDEEIANAIDYFCFTMIKK